MTSPSPDNAMILVVNAGSATLKLSLFHGESVTCRALIDRLGPESSTDPHALIQDGNHASLFDKAIPVTSSEQALQWFFDWMEQHLLESRPAAVGHRVVHGGDSYSAPVRVTPELVEQLEKLTPLAPLHQPHNVAPIRALMERDATLPQVACFDTAFHSGQSRLERTYALPRDYFEKGVKKYGFHGLSYEYVTSQLPRIDLKAATGRTVICHLGNGASACAVLAGKSVASSMGFTALEGLTMGTRCGSIDPGVLLHLLEQEQMSVSDLNTLLYQRSGLLGLSGISSDMRDLLANEEPAAVEAVDQFCYRIAREVGSMVPVLGGLDAVVFTGGIGEHAAPVREKVCLWLTCFGVQLDSEANSDNRSVLHLSESGVHLFVIPTNEELQIARHVRSVLAD